MAVLLATLEDLAASRGVEFDPTDLRAIIALEDASATVRQAFDLALDDTVADEVTLDGSGTDALLLPELPVNGVASVAIVSGDMTATLVEGTDYVRSGSIL